MVGALRWDVELAGSGARFPHMVGVASVGVAGGRSVRAAVSGARDSLAPGAAVRITGVDSCGSGVSIVLGRPEHCHSGLTTVLSTPIVEPPEE